MTGTGLRLGWMALPPSLAPPVVALIGHMGAWPARPIQKAAAELYSKPKILENYFKKLDGQIAERMDVLEDRLTQLSDYGVSYVKPEGVIYLTTRFNLFNQLGVQTNEEIRQWLLESAGVAIVPFQAFGLDDESGWFRISVGSVGVDDIIAAMDRLESALKTAFGHVQRA